MMKGTAKSQGGQWIGGRTQYFTVGNLNRVK
jgi:YD repeat protein